LQQGVKPVAALAPPILPQNNHFIKPFPDSAISQSGAHHLVRFHFSEQKTTVDHRILPGQLEIRHMNTNHRIQPAIIVAVTNLNGNPDIERIYYHHPGEGNIANRDK
jgi:hypothetical protein